MSRKEFVVEVARLLKPYWVSERRGKGLRLLAVTVGLTLGIVYVNVRLAAWSNDFYNTIQEKNLDRFYVLLGTFSLLAAAYIIMAIEI